MSQFFGSNPGDRSPQGPKRGPWRPDLPRTWQDALGISEGRGPAEDATAGPDGHAHPSESHGTAGAASAEH